MRMKRYPTRVTTQIIPHLRPLATRYSLRVVHEYSSANVHLSLLNRHRLQPQRNPLPPLRKHPPLVSRRCRFLRSANNHNRIPRLALLCLSMLVQPQDLVKVHLASHRPHLHLASRHLAQFYHRNLKVLSGNLCLGNQLLLNQRLGNRRLGNHQCWGKLHLHLQTKILYQHRRLGKRLLLQQQIFPNLHLANQPLASHLFLKASHL